MGFYGVECFELERVIRGQGKWERVWDSCRGVLESGFAVKTGGMGWYGFGGSGGLAGVPNKVMEWVLCVQWLRLAVTGARIGPSKSSQSLSIAHKWAVVID
ncbi:hypothetical protein Tco_1237778 [Tanacetum coccineum]